VANLPGSFQVLDFTRSPMLALRLSDACVRAFPTRYQSMRMFGRSFNLSPAVLFAVAVSAILLPSWSAPMSGQPLPRLFDGSLPPARGKARSTTPDRARPSGNGLAEALEARRSC
jgi:hypothetical protein